MGRAQNTRRAVGDPFAAIPRAGRGAVRASLYDDNQAASGLARELAAQCRERGRFDGALDALCERPELMAPGTAAAELYEELVHGTCRQLLATDGPELYWPLLAWLGTVEMNEDDGQVRFIRGSAQELYDTFGRALHERLWKRVQNGTARDDFSEFSKLVLADSVTEFLSLACARDGADGVLSDEWCEELSAQLAADEREVGRMLDKALWVRVIAGWTDWRHRDPDLSLTDLIMALIGERGGATG